MARESENKMAHKNGSQRAGRGELIAVALLFLVSFSAIFFITGQKVNQYGHGDPLLTLPTAQAIVQTGRPYLTHLADRPIAPLGRPLSEVVGNYQAAIHNQEIVDVYSPGPALTILPLVAVLDRVGFDFANLGTNLAVQNRLTFLTAAVALTSLFALCLTRLTLWPAFLVSHITFFGSAIFANMGLAFFNINFTIIFIIWGLFILARLQTGSIQARFLPLNGVVLGLSLFGAFAQRPSAALFIFITFGYLLLNHRRVAYWAMGSAALGLLAFSIWSNAQYGLILPLYYDTGKSPELLPPLWVGVLGNLFSPSRGLFVTMPWLFLLFVLLIRSKNSFKLDHLLPWILIWMSGLVILISRSVIWWGGSSFGARLLAEAIPGLVLILIILWDENQARWSIIFRRGTITAFLALGLFSMWGHSYQPFFNVYTGGPWLNSISGYPTQPDARLSSYFQPQYSQILANETRVCTLQADLADQIMLDSPEFFSEIDINQEVTLNGPDAAQYNLEQFAFAHLSGDLTALKQQPILLTGFLVGDGLILRTCDGAAAYFVATEAWGANGAIELTFFIDDQIQLRTRSTDVVPGEVNLLPVGNLDSFTHVQLAVVRE